MICLSNVIFTLSSLLLLEYNEPQAIMARAGAAANRGSCDFNDVVAFGHNQLWRPAAAKRLYESY